MRRLIRVLVVWMGGVGCFTSSVTARTWTDKTGQFTTEAELIEVKDEKAFLKKADGQVIGIATSELSEVDQEYLKSLDPHDAVGYYNRGNATETRVNTTRPSPTTPKRFASTQSLPSRTTTAVSPIGRRARTPKPTTILHRPRNLASTRKHHRTATPQRLRRIGRPRLGLRSTD